MSKTHLSDLGENFEYWYDTGEGWDFFCKVMKRKYKYNEIQDEELPLALVVEGKGQGIFENDHQTL